LPEALIAAVILQESGGDPSAYSSSGAVGLMQVMPRDGIAAEFMCVNGPRILPIISLMAARCWQAYMQNMARIGKLFSITVR